MTVTRKWTSCSLTTDRLSGDHGYLWLSKLRRDAAWLLCRDGATGSCDSRFALVRVVRQKEASLQIPRSRPIGRCGVFPEHCIVITAAEFKRRALRIGCREYGIYLTYRPVGRQHFSGHIDRLGRTLMRYSQLLSAAQSAAIPQSITVEDSSCTDISCGAVSQTSTSR